MRRAGPLPPGLADAPDVLPVPSEVQRVIQRMQKKDLYGIFREPVTDEVVRLLQALPVVTITLLCSAGLVLCQEASSSTYSAHGIMLLSWQGGHAA